MPAITKAQRAAIKRIFDRGPVYPQDIDARRIVMDAGWSFGHRGHDVWDWQHPNLNLKYGDHNEIIATYFPQVKPLTYCQFRRTVQHGYDCLMVRWCGMWLGIEKDGYVHS